MTDNNRGETTFGECALINDSTYSPKEDWPFINYLDTGNITENRVDQIRHLVASQDKIPSRARRKVQPGDIVYSTVRPNQRHFGILKELHENFLASTAFAVIRGNGDTAETDYLYYFLSQDHIVDHLHTIAEHSTSAYPSIKPSDIASLDLSLPPLDEQRRIARILGTLDDKIELNRRMSETLEAMAQALFKSWFVDFDPVRAKAEGRPTGLPPDLDALFPDSFQDSQLGEIPEGWRVGLLGDIAKTVRGRSYRSAELAESDTALVTLKSFARGGGYRPEGLKPYTGKYKPEQVIKPGELVIACTDVTQAAEVVGRPALVLPDQRFTTLVASLDTMILRPLDTDATPVAYLYGLTSSPAFASHTYAHVTGTTVLHLQKDAVPEFRFPLSPIEVIEAFGNLASRTASRAAETAIESERLALHRDNLLRHLISDEHGGIRR